MVHIISAVVLSDPFLSLSLSRVGNFLIVSLSLSLSSHNKVASIGPLLKTHRSNVCKSVHRLVSYVAQNIYTYIHTHTHTPITGTMMEAQDQEVSSTSERQPEREEKFFPKDLIKDETLLQLAYINKGDNAAWFKLDQIKGSSSLPECDQSDRWLAVELTPMEETEEVCKFIKRYSPRLIIVLFKLEDISNNKHPILSTFHGKFICALDFVSKTVKLFSDHFGQIEGAVGIIFFIDTYLTHCESEVPPILSDLMELLKNFK